MFVMPMVIRGDINSDGSTHRLINAGLTKIPSGLSERLQILDLSNNISVIPADSFINFTKCRSLYITHNQIHTIEANAFRGLKNLEFLDLKK